MAQPQEITVVKGEAKEKWQHLCERAAVEQDPETLLDLVQQINRMLEEKAQRLKRERSSPEAAPADKIE